MSVLYTLLAVFRVFSSVFIQNGYIHPDEFFQTTEIITGDFFGVVHKRPWEFNKDAPVRSIGLLYGIFGVPIYIVKWIFEYHKIPWNPYMLLIVFRIVTCAISFITDYSLYKICKILKIKYNRYLLLLSSSYVIIVFGTKTFTNSLELALVSLLLWKVIDCMVFSEKVLAAENEIRNTNGHSTSITDKIILIRKLRQLPSHHYRHCLEIGTILATGTFNRPTFLLYAVTPIFYWISRGFSKNYNPFLRTFNLRFLVLFLCVLPGVLLFIIFDSFYYEHVTDDELNLVITPLNFIKYNLNSTNLATHGVHLRVTHAIINVPLLFNALAFLYLKRLRLENLVKIIMNHHYHLLPNIHEVNTLMMANVIIPLSLLSVFPHQEPRFLLPLLLPIVFTTSKYFSNYYIRKAGNLFPIWCFCNMIGLIFYGYLHQAGVTPMISHLFKDIKYVSDVHFIHSHIYSVPVGLLMIPRFNESRPYMNHRRINVYNLGSSLDTHVLYDSVKNISKTVNDEDRQALYFALSGPLAKKFELVCKMSNLNFTKQLFFPHLSMESLHFYYVSLFNLLTDENNTYFLKEFCEIFSLVLYKITTTTE